jgi:hypothetical protein
LAKELRKKSAHCPPPGPLGLYLRAAISSATFDKVSLCVSSPNPGGDQHTGRSCTCGKACTQDRGARPARRRCLHSRPRWHLGSASTSVVPGCTSPRQS